MRTTINALLGLAVLFVAAAPVAEKKAVFGDTKPVGPYSPAVDVGDTVYLAGQIALADGKLVTGGIQAETHQVMKNVEAVLTNAGLDFSNIVKATVFLQDVGDFQAMNEVYGTYFEGTIPPARTTVAVAAIPLGAKVEIEFIAVR